MNLREKRIIDRSSSFSLLAAAALVVLLILVSLTLVLLLMICVVVVVVVEGSITTRSTVAVPVPVNEIVDLVPTGRQHVAKINGTAAGGRHGVFVFVFGKRSAVVAAVASAVVSFVPVVDGIRVELVDVPDPPIVSVQQDRHDPRLEALPLVQRDPANTGAGAHQNAGAVLQGNARVYHRLSDGLVSNSNSVLLSVLLSLVFRRCVRVGKRWSLPVSFFLGTASCC
mmetsp:Transcript_26621/g.55832  ORF Transcript_26621/g.55832 Transcript_26621/m.55832 type:complete len:226 (+) Transcript_26621:773-1450(+)